MDCNNCEKKDALLLEAGKLFLKATEMLLKIPSTLATGALALQLTQVANLCGKAMEIGTEK